MPRAETPCPGIRICCPTCGGVVYGAEIPYGEGFFRCQHRRGLQKCGQHFYVACTDYLCTTIAITLAERNALRMIDGVSAKLEWLRGPVARAA